VRSASFANASSLIRLVSCSSVIETAHEVCAFWRWVSVTLAPATVER
jgi:hypothetical protein